MTYCVGLLVEAGLVLIADTRTNAGVDNISTFKKLHILADETDRLIVAACAGSLSVSQSMLSILAEGLPSLDDGGVVRTVATQPTMLPAKTSPMREVAAHSALHAEPEQVSLGLQTVPQAPQLFRSFVLFAQ